MKSRYFVTTTIDPVLLLWEVLDRTDRTADGYRIVDFFSTRADARKEAKRLNETSAL